MEELNIKTHNFDKAKEAINEFSRKSETETYFGNVKQKNFLGFKHTVTGEELNQFVYQVQEKFVEQSKTQVATIKEFGQIYNALESLDKDYIQSIMIALKGVQTDQKEIKKLYKVQEATVEKLKRNIENVKNIDVRTSNRTMFVIWATLISILSIANLVIGILLCMHKI